MIHNFNIELAKRYGVEEAILLHNLAFWTMKNKANDRHYYDGLYWTYNSIKAFSELFPYWTERQIRYILKKLTDKKIIKKGNYNKNPFDKTMWYAIIDDYTLELYGISHNKNVDFDMTKLSHRSEKNVQSITYNYTDNIHIEGRKFSNFHPIKGKKIDIEKEKKIIMDDGRRSAGGKSAVGRSDGAISFSSSGLWDDEILLEKFRAMPEKRKAKYRGIDVFHYRDIIGNWAEANGKRKKDWFKTILNAILRDMKEGKVKYLETYIREKEKNKSLWD